MLIPLQFSLMMNTMPTGQIFFKSMMFFCKEKKNEWIPLQQQYLFAMVFLAYREQRTNFISVTVFTSCGIKEVLCWYFRVRWVVEFWTWRYNYSKNQCTKSIVFWLKLWKYNKLEQIWTYQPQNSNRGRESEQNNVKSLEFWHCFVPITDRK